MCCGPPRPDQTSSSVILICISTGGCSSGCRDNNLRVIATSFGNLSTSRSRSSSSRVGSRTRHTSRNTSRDTRDMCHAFLTPAHTVTRSHEPARDPARKVLPLHLPAFKDGIKLRSPTSYHQLMTAACSCNRQPPPSPQPSPAK